MKNELKCTDLRIGNYVLFNNVRCKIAEIERDRVVIEYHNGDTDYYYIYYIDPIELTEEMLKKIGFEKDGNNYSLVCGDIEVGFYIDNFKQVLYINVSREKRFYKNELRSYDVKYLHQLQNTYHTLTGKELEVEL